MANKLRIHVKFGETKVLVPCGDGNILISDMVEKAIGKYKKANKLHADDRVVVSQIYQDGGSVVDMDDDVCDVFDDKEMVCLEYKFIPHDAPPNFVPVTVGGMNLNSTELPSNTPCHPPQPRVATPPTKPQPIINNDKPHKHTSIVDSVVNNPPSSQLLNESTTSSMTTSYLPPPDSGYESRFGTGSDQSPPLDPHISNGEHPFDYDYEYYGSMGGEGDNDNDSENHTNEFEQEDQHSQVIDDPVNSSFSEIEPSGHPVASQVSINSFEGASQPSVGGNSQQRFTHSPSNNYNMMTPQGGYHNNNNNSSQVSTSQPGLDNGAGKGNLDSPNLGGTNFHFTPSQSIERLSDIHNSSNRHMTASIDNNNNNQSPYRTSNSNNNPSFHMQPMLSQEAPYSMGGHGLHDNYTMQSDQYNMMVMSQVDPHNWPPRMYPNMAGYPPRGGPPIRGRYGMEYGSMRPEFDRSSVSSDYEFRNPYQTPPSMFQDKRRKQSMQEESMKMGRGPPHHVSPSYPDMYGYQRQFYHGPDEDPSFEIALSQPASYMMYPPQQHPYNRYQNFQPQPPMPPGGGPPPGMGMGRMNGNRLKNVPSGYSLSQGGEPRMRNFGFDKLPNKPRKSNLRNSGDKRVRSDSMSKESKYSIDEEVLSDDEDHMKPSPFRRSSRKSMFLDDGSVWGQWQEKLANMDFDEYYSDDNNDVPHHIGESSQRTNSPPSDDGKEKEEPTDLGHLHIVELLRGDEPLGIQLVSYTSKGRDLGVFIGEMDRGGFAAKSGELQLFDRILACNGEDFTSESNKRVEERLREMTSKEPLLRMAVSRGLNLDLEQSLGEEEDDNNNEQQERNVNKQNGGPNQVTAGDRNTVDEDNKGSINTSTQSMISTSVTNTRQLGVRKTIEITKKGTFGFGLSSRDVATNTDDIPIYVKSITSGGAAFQDGRLRIGDRILEVNGVSVKGMVQSEVLNLLRNSSDNLVLVISRQQQAMEPQDEYSELSQPIDQGPLPAPIDKSVLIVNIPLDDCGLHGLGVTVYGRCSRRKAEDVGIYIKGIQPGGAAAKEGSLRVNDRLLSVNNQSLVNMSNASALEALKKGLQQANPGDDSSIHLTIARTAGVNRKLSLSMSSFSNQMPALQEEDRTTDTTEIGIDCPPELRNMSQEIDHHDTLYEDDYNFISQNSSSSLISFGKPQDIASLSLGSFPGSQAPFSNPLKSDYEATSNKMSSTKMSPSNMRRSTIQGITETDSTRNNHHRHDNEYSNERVSKHSSNARPSYSDTNKKYSPMRHSSVSPTMSEQVTWFMGDPQSRGSTTSRGSSHSPTTSYSRPSSLHSESDRSSTHGYHKSLTNSSTGPAVLYGGHARVGSGSFRRRVSPPYDTLECSPTKERKQYENNPTQKTASTLPRQGSGRNITGRTTPDQDDTTSLYSYSSDPELSTTNPFQRDDINRKSIPKKKSSAQPNFSHLKFNNVVPRLEGEGPPSPPLYRTGSDGDISVNNHYLPKEMFSNIEVGPNLRMAKSSSLESLQTVMHYTIRADIRDNGNRSSGRGTRSSFRRAVDRSYSGEPLPSSAMISLTKSPQKRKQPKKGIFSWIKTRKTKSGGKKDKNRNSRPGSCVDFDSIGDIAKQYGISEKTILRMQSHSGKLDGDDDLTSDEEEDYEEDDDYDSSMEMNSLRHSRAL